MQSFERSEVEQRKLQTVKICFSFACFYSPPSIESKHRPNASRAVFFAPISVVLSLFFGANLGSYAVSTAVANVSDTKTNRVCVWIVKDELKQINADK